MNYNSIPLSKRIEKNMNSEKRTLNHDIRGRDVNWRSGINTIDPETGLTPLMTAVMQGKKDLVVALIERGANVESHDAKKGRTPLQIAAKEGHYEIIKELMKRDAIINSTDNHQKTALMHASKAGYLDCVNTLLNCGAGVNMIDDNGYTALHYASKFGHHLIVIELIKAAASIESRDNRDGYAALHFASQYGRKETVLALLSYNARINRRSSKEKITPLMLASREGNKTIVSLLISKGADVNCIDIHGWTALHFASSWGRRDTAHILIVDGHANVNAKDPTRDEVGGTTPLIVACKGSQIPVIKLLIHYGADINLNEDHFGQNPIIAAAELGHSNVIECLIDYHVQINYQNPFTGMTALMTAAAKGKRSALISLLNHYADMNIIDYKFLTAFEHADHNKTRDILLSAIINITPAAKTNLLPWLEVHCPLLIRQSTYGGPSVFLNSFLYGNKGCFYGLYNATRDRDIYLIYSLMMILSACQQSKSVHIRDIPDLNQKIQFLEDMIEQCMTSRNMMDDITFTDCFIIGSTSCSELNDNSNIMKYFMNSFFFGPLALYLENNLTKLLSIPILRDKIDASFITTVKSPNLIIDGYGKESHFLLWRYNPACMFLLEGIGQCIFILLILLFSFYSHSSSYYYSKKVTSSSISEIDNKVDTIEILLLIMTGCFAAYQFGLLEEKRWMISPSIVFDSSILEQFRYKKLYQHYLESPWNFIDLITTILTLTWFIIRIIVLFVYSSSTITTTIAYYHGVSGEILLLALLPLSIGLIRYFSVFQEWLDYEILTIFLLFIDLFIYLIIFILFLLSFSVIYYSIYHQEVYSFHSYAMTIKTLFNAILLNYDDSIFDHSNNTNYGYAISCIFFILMVFIFFNGIIGKISSSYPINKEYSKQWSAQIKARLVQRYCLILEKSGLAMLPPPFNALLIPIYPCHVYSIWRARLSLQQRTTTSIGGTASDYILGFLFLIPSAIYEYIAVDVLNSEKGLMFSLFYFPIGLMYIIVCLLYKICAEPTVQVVLKTRVSDGRVRISYSLKRDLFEEQSLTRFEDSRIFKDLQVFQQHPSIFNILPSPRNGEDIFSVVSEGDSISKLTNPGKKRLRNDENPENFPSLLSNIWKGVLHKRQNDPLGNKIRIAPNTPFIQLNNVNELNEALPGVVQKKPTTLLEHEMIMKITKQKKEEEAKKVKTIWLAHDIHSEYHASMAPNVSEIESILQGNDSKPPLMWTNNNDEGGGARGGGSPGPERPKTSKINPYQPGILYDSQWNELAGEIEPRDTQISLTGGYNSPARPSTAIPDPSFVTTTALDPKSPTNIQRTLSRVQTPAGKLLTRPNSPEIILEKSMINPTDKQFLLKSKQEKIIQKEKYFHHQDNYHLLDEQAIDHFKQLNQLSLYFQLSKFPSIYYENERKEIFYKVLKDLFLDDFAYQIESNEKYFIELKMTIDSLQKLNIQQNATIEQLLQKISLLEGKTNTNNYNDYSRGNTPFVVGMGETNYDYTNYNYDQYQQQQQQPQYEGYTNYDWQETTANTYETNYDHPTEVQHGGAEILKLN